MSTKPLVINKNSRRYKLYTIWSMGCSPKKAWHYRCGVAIMTMVYCFMVLFIIVEVVAVLVLVAAAASPVVLHYWPNSPFFDHLHERLYGKLLPAFQITLVVTPLILLAYWQRDRLSRLGVWLISHKPVGRPIKIIED